MFSASTKPFTLDSQSRDFQGNTDKWRRFVVLAGEEIQRKAPTHEADFEEDEMDVPEEKGAEELADGGARDAEQSQGPQEAMPLPGARGFVRSLRNRVVAFRSKIVQSLSQLRNAEAVPEGGPDEKPVGSNTGDGTVPSLEAKPEPGEVRPEQDETWEDEEERRFEEQVGRARQEKAEHEASQADTLGKIYRNFTSTLQGIQEQEYVEPDVGPYLRKLLELDLSRCQLEELPPEFGRFSSLTSLKVNGNRLTVLPRSISALSRLTHLSLAENYLTQVPGELGHMRMLSVCDLSRQSGGQGHGPPFLLKDLPVSMRKLRALRELRLSYNNFQEVPSSIFPSAQDPGMTGLRVLALDHNPLKRVDDDLAYCGNMERLLLHNTHINSVNASIRHMYMLKELWISDTRIKRLDEAVAHLPHIRKVGLVMDWSLGSIRSDLMPSNVCTLLYFGRSCATAKPSSTIGR